MDHTSCAAIRQAVSEITREECIELDELEAFAEEFKRKRRRLGLTQRDVGLGLGHRFGVDFSHSTISRFETLNLSFSNMGKLKSLLSEWLAYAEAAIENGTTVCDLLEAAPSHSQNQPLPNIFGSSNSGTNEAYCTAEMSESRRSLRKRRKRTILDVSQRVPLALYFKLNPRPDHYKIAKLAEILELERDVVRVWFYNRRQKVCRNSKCL
ncbi:unnamed protein product [Dracunculus medinensis]|uniref:POU domain protein n=1 Tax=Dracunculus medinensis TaxID=318479 RepID=A0A0N4U115_DRAME|nr:unnamed protein product [Dracunculus medinensis]